MRKNAEPSGEVKHERKGLKDARIKGIKIKLVKILKLVTLNCCVVCFILNVHISIENYLDDATVQQTSTQKDKSRLPLPAFLVCNGVGYKDSDVDPWGDSDYLNLTRDPDDFDIHVITNGLDDPELDPSKYTLTVWNTAHHGRCMSVEFKHMVLLLQNHNIPSTKTKTKM